MERVVLHWEIPGPRELARASAASSMELLPLPSLGVLVEAMEWILPRNQLPVKEPSTLAKKSGRVKAKI